MEINIKNAIKRFYPSPSLEMVYFEAVANSIDAGASEISIYIEIEEFNNPETLKVKIQDNGIGFTNENFKKFSKLMEVKDEYHKGLGRLVYLNYFNTASISSQYEDKKREFLFDHKFQGNSEIQDSTSEETGTIIELRDYSKKQIKTYEYLKPVDIRKSLLLHFFPLFHSYKVANKVLKIKIELKTEKPHPDKDFYSDTQVIDVTKLPKLKSLPFNDQTVSLTDEFELFYEINHSLEDTNVTTAICAEGRTIAMDVFPKENVPSGYELTFLLYSEYFDGKVNNSRQKLELDDSSLRAVRNLLVTKINEIIDIEIPHIKERNDQLQSSLNNRYPHLQGYFDRRFLGLADRNKSIEAAQKKFFLDQKRVLETNELDDKLFLKSLEMSSRVLTEYVLYRQKIIKKLKDSDFKDSEEDLHNIIIPMRQTFHSSKFINDIYSNNIWLLDDKFMTYTTILSDQEFDKLVDELSLEEEKVKDTTRPDIAIVFSRNPENDSGKVDVVIVELKKKGIKLAKKEEVISQLKQRARKILKYYPDKIQRIWFYGIVDFHDEFRISLKEDNYAPLYSEDQLYYKEQTIIVDEAKDIRIPVGLYVLSYDALILDAENRNSTFLNILKEELKRNLKLADLKLGTSKTA